MLIQAFLPYRSASSGAYLSSYGLKSVVVCLFLVFNTVNCIFHFPVLMQTNEVWVIKSALPVYSRFNISCFYKAIKNCIPPKLFILMFVHILEALTHEFQYNSNILTLESMMSFNLFVSHKLRNLRKVKPPQFLCKLHCSALSKANVHCEGHRQYDKPC